MLALRAFGGALSGVGAVGRAPEIGGGANAHIRPDDGFACPAMVCNPPPACSTLDEVTCKTRSDCALQTCAACSGTVGSGCYRLGDPPPSCAPIPCLPPLNCDGLDETSCRAMAAALPTTARTARAARRSQGAPGLEKPSRARRRVPRPHRAPAWIWPGARPDQGVARRSNALTVRVGSSTLAVPGLEKASVAGGVPLLNRAPTSPLRALVTRDRIATRCSSKAQFATAPRQAVAAVSLGAPMAAGHCARDRLAQPLVAA
jgi:hypothetical protein